MCNLSKALIELGIEQGIEQRKISVAQMMIQENEPVEKIERYTGYTLERLKEIADTLGSPLMME